MCYVDCGEPITNTRQFTMLTVCPTCRHRFLQPEHFQEPSEQDGWKEAKEEDEKKKFSDTVHPPTATCYVGGLLVPHEYSNGDSCLNAPTIIHGSTVVQSSMTHCDSDIGIIGSDETVEFSCDSKSSTKQDDCSLLKSLEDQVSNQASLIMAVKNVACETSSEQHIVTTCKLTGGSVTITKPDVQWNNGLIQSTKDEIRIQPPHIEIRSKFTGGGCLIEKSLSTEIEQLLTSKCTESSALADNNAHQMLIAPPSGCSELPGNKWILSPRTIKENSEITSPELKQSQQTIERNKCCDCRCMVQQKLCRCYQRSAGASLLDNHDSLLLKPVGSGVQIRLNTTVQLPANFGQCRVNITATTAPCNQVTKPTTKPRTRNNFNGGGIVQPEETDCTTRNRIITIKDNNSKEWKNGAPITPMSLLMPCPWNLSTDLLNKDVNRLREVRKLLQICGWYHEGISWQQSENLLKNASIGRWLMRDSSDSKYIFAISIQTARGPTSVRVHYFLEQFRLDAEPRLTLAVPLFSCPISMLEHYVEYSKIEHQREVWVDYNGQLYSHIYLTKPLVKEVRTLSHLARLAVNRNKLPTKHLPLLIRNYLAEYPYTL